MNNQQFQWLNCLQWRTKWSIRRIADEIGDVSENEVFYALQNKKAPQEWSDKLQKKRARNERLKLLRKSMRKKQI